MPSVNLTLHARVNGQPLVGFPVERRMESLVAFDGPETEQLAASGNIDLFAVGTLQILLVQPSGVVVIGPNGGPTTGATAIRLNPGGVLLAFNISIAEGTSNSYTCPSVPTETVIVAAGGTPTLT